MSQSDVPTIRQMHFPAALVVGGSPALIGSVGTAALGAQVLVAECSVSDAPTVAAQMRPLVMVMNRTVYETDADGFEALARDVRSQVLVVERDDPDPTPLEAKLAALVAEAERKRASE